MAGQNEDDYVITDGERICSTAIGWNFGDGHMHNEQLIAAMQQRCGFAPGEVRVVLLDAQPIHKQTQAYRLVDAATGEFERGIVKVADMVTRQPWADDVPVQVLSEPAERARRASHRGRAQRFGLGGLGPARTSWAAATMFCSDAVTSSVLRVFRPQSGLTQSRCAGTAFNAARSDCGHLVGARAPAASGCRRRPGRRCWRSRSRSGRRSTSMCERAASMEVTSASRSAIAPITSPNSE